MNDMPATKPTPHPTEMDDALLDVISRALEHHGKEVARLEHVWHGGAGMWFVEVVPQNDLAAPLSVAFDGHDLVTITVGRTWFEVFPVKQVADLDYIGELAAAVFEGNLEETERGGFGRLSLLDGRVIRIGVLHLPIPWKLRRVRRYAPYGHRQMLS